MAEAHEGVYDSPTALIGATSEEEKEEYFQMGDEVPPDLSEALRSPLPKSPGRQGGTDEYCKLEIFGETEILRELSGAGELEEIRKFMNNLTIRISGGGEGPAPIRSMEQAIKAKEGLLQTRDMIRITEDLPACLIRHWESKTVAEGIGLQNESQSASLLLTVKALGELVTRDALLLQGCAKNRIRDYDRALADYERARERVTRRNQAYDTRGTQNMIIRGDSIPAHYFNETPRRRKIATVQEESSSEEDAPIDEEDPNHQLHQIQKELEMGAADFAKQSGTTTRRKLPSPQLSWEMPEGLLTDGEREVHGREPWMEITQIRNRIIPHIQEYPGVEHYTVKQLVGAFNNKYNSEVAADSQEILGEVEAVVGMGDNGPVWTDGGRNTRQLEYAHNSASENPMEGRAITKKKVSPAGFSKLAVSVMNRNLRRNSEENGHDIVTRKGDACDAKQSSAGDRHRRLDNEREHRPPAAKSWYENKEERAT